MKKQFAFSFLMVLFLLAPVMKSMAQTTAKPAAQPTAKPAQTGTWDAIGTVKAARMGGDHDMVTVPEPLMHYSKLKFKVTDAPLNIKKMVVTYDNGETQTISNKYQIKKQLETRYARFFCFQVRVLICFSLFRHTTQV